MRTTDDELEGEMNLAIKNLSLTSISQVESLDISRDVPSNVIWTRPSGKDRRLPLAWIPSAYIATQILQHLTQRDGHTQAAFFARMSGHPWSRSAAGWMFETWVHGTLMSATEVTCNWTHRPPGFSHPSVIPATTRENIRNLKQDAIPEKPFYWRPPGSNFPGIDAVLYVGGTVYAVQATISSRHRSAEPGLVKIFEQLRASFKKCPLCLLFVTATEASARKLGADPHLTAGWLAKTTVGTSVLRFQETTMPTQVRRIGRQGVYCVLISSQQNTSNVDDNGDLAFGMEVDSEWELEQADSG
jgi:hypothetical protein